jgi:hypothetical protein
VIWGSPSAREVLEFNGFRDVASTFGRVPPARSRHAGRSVVEHLLVTPGGRQVRAFVKLYCGSGRWWPRMTDLKTGQAWQSLPWREWSGIGQLQTLGFSVPERLGLFCEGFWRRRAAVILGAVRPVHSLDDLIRSGHWRQLAAADRESILDEAVALLRRIHAAGLAWRGVCTRHFFPEQVDGVWKHWLIDLEGVHRRGHNSMSRDYSKLHRAMRYSGADSETIRMLESKTAA